MWRGGGGGDPTPLVVNLSKTSALGDVEPNFSFRHIPSNSVNFRRLPFPHALSNLDYNMLYGWVDAKVPDPIFR